MILGVGFAADLPTGRQVAGPLLIDKTGWASVNLIFHFLRPFVPVVWAKFPGGKIIFDIAEHAVPLLRCITVFHNEAAAKL